MWLPSNLEFYSCRCVCSSDCTVTRLGHVEWGPCYSLSCSFLGGVVRHVLQSTDEATWGAVLSCLMQNLYIGDHSLRLNGLWCCFPRLHLKISLSVVWRFQPSVSHTPYHNHLDVVQDALKCGLNGVIPQT